LTPVTAKVIIDGGSFDSGRQRTEFYEIRTPRRGIRLLFKMVAAAYDRCRPKR